MLFVTSGSSVYAQNLISQIVQSYGSLDSGNELKIKCFSGLFAEFVADCSSPNTCQALRIAGNNTLECVPKIILDDGISGQFRTP
jgi:hypothetical protein